MADENQISYEEPKPDILNKAVDNIKVTIDNGGWKGTLFKFLLWGALPLVILLVIAYYLRTSFFGRKANISTRNAQNNSVRYKDEKTDWQFQVVDVRNTADVDDDIKKFEELSKKVKGLYIK